MVIICTSSFISKWAGILYLWVLYNSQCNHDYLLKQRYPADLCNGEVWCSLWGTDWIFKYRLAELRLRIYVVEWQKGQWMINSKGYWRKWLWPNLKNCQGIYPEGLGNAQSVQWGQPVSGPRFQHGTFQKCAHVLASSCQNNHYKISNAILIMIYASY
jgi:hypothetical protein